MKKRIHLSTLSPQRTFLPYFYGQMRSHCEQYPEIRDNYSWDEPTFLPDQLKNLDQLIKDPDIFGAQCFMWNFSQNMKICQWIKDKYPNCLVVIGGQNLPHDTTHFFDKYPFVDLIVHGEGELAFSNILMEHLQSKPNRLGISGLSVQDKTRSIKTGHPLRISPEISTPSPFKRGYFEQSISLLKKMNIPYTVIWETNRGCPFECPFCAASSLVSGTKKVRMFSNDRLKDDIEYFGTCEASSIFIVDSNLGLFPRDLEIASDLAKQKKIYGYPKTIRSTFSVGDSKRVYEMSKIFHNAKMLWAANQNFQSLNSPTKAVLSRKEPIDQIKQLIKEQYKSDRIPICTELILGMPEETKDSFIHGIADLIRVGYHEDIRLNEFFVLPNTQVDTKDFQDKYGLKLASIPLDFLLFQGEPEERPKIVVATHKLTHEDWLYCYVFYEIIRSMHNGAYTRFISIFLEKENLVSYEEFYTTMEDHFLECHDSVLGRLLMRIKRLLRDYAAFGNIPNLHKVDSQPDMVKEVSKYVGSRKICFPHRYLWLALADQFECFFAELEDFIYFKWPQCRNMIFSELLKFQREIMLRPSFDPCCGKKCSYLYNWHDYFFAEDHLQKKAYEVIYRDRFMGPDNQYPIIPLDLLAFSKAAIGIPWPSPSHRCFFHQYDSAEIRRARIS